MKSAIVNNLKIYSPFSREELIDYAFANKSILVAINAEKILHANKISREIINNNIGYPDGIGAVLALRKKKIRDAIKIPGCELWLEIISKFYRDKSFYLIGSKQHIIEATVESLKKEFKGINICNYRNGYFKSKIEEKKLIEDIIKHQPEIIFVAMGSPKQEQLLYSIQQKYKVLSQGLGGSFDVYSGEVRRASNWFIKNNLEWAFRLIKQPKRILRQVYIIKFIYFLFLKKF